MTVEFVNIHHPQTGDTGRVPRRALPGQIARGWVEGELPPATPAPTSEPLPDEADPTT